MIRNLLNGFVAFLVLILGSPAQDGRKGVAFCETRPIPLSFPKEVGLEIVSHDFTLRQTYLAESMVAGLSVRNNTGRRIAAITVFVNYYGSDEVFFYSIPFGAHLDNDPQETGRAGPPLFYENLLGRHVEPGNVVHLVGSNALDTNRFPESAKVSKIEVHFVPGYMDHSFGAARWVVHPLLKSAPEALEIRPPEFLIGEDVLLTLVIDDRGRVGSVGAQGGHRVPNETYQSIQQELRKLNFFPAMEDGYAVESTLNLILRFQPHAAAARRMCSSLERPSSFLTFAIVDLFPEGNNRWSVYFSGFPAGREFGPQAVR